MDVNEYNRLQHANAKITGFGAEVRCHVPCPFCCAPDYRSYLIFEVQKANAEEAVCKACGRGSKFIFTQPTPEQTFMEMVQTRGPDPDLPFLPKIRRVTE